MNVTMIVSEILVLREGGNLRGLMQCMGSALCAQVLTSLPFPVCVKHSWFGGGHERGAARTRLGHSGHLQALVGGRHHKPSGAQFYPSALAVAAPCAAIFFSRGSSKQAQVYQRPSLHLDRLLLLCRPDTTTHNLEFLFLHRNCFFPSFSRRSQYAGPSRGYECVTPRHRALRQLLEAPKRAA